MEFGLAAAKANADLANRKSVLPRLDNCDFCGQAKPTIKCQQCRGVAYCTRACAKKGRKKHRKACAEIANNPATEDCEGGMRDLGSFTHLADATLKCKADWYDREIRKCCHSLDNKNRGDTVGQ